MASLGSSVVIGLIMIIGLDRVRPIIPGEDRPTYAARKFMAVWRLFVPVV